MKYEFGKYETCTWCKGKGFSKNGDRCENCRGIGMVKINKPHDKDGLNG